MSEKDVVAECPTVERILSCNIGRPKYSLKNNIKKVFHCPVEICKYHLNGRFFKNIKCLRQHYVKVHKSKNFLCEKCKKNFPLESTLNRHMLTCGVNYRCHCKAAYKTYEALLTHSKRKKHNISLLYKDMMTCLKAHSAAARCSSDDVKLHTLIIQSPRRPAAIRVGPLPILPKRCSETQTSSAVDRKTVSLQTSGVFRRRRKSRTTRPPTPLTTVNTSGTQTTPIKENLAEQFYYRRPFDEPSDSFDAIDIAAHRAAINFGYEDESLCSESTFMLPEKPLRSPEWPDPCSPNSFTALADKQSDYDSLFDFDTTNDLLGYADSQTQTSLADYFDGMYSDMHTQTCDSLFNGYDFVDIETQTEWSAFNDPI